MLEIHVRDSHITGRPDVGHISFPLRDLPADGIASVVLPLEPANPGQKKEGEIVLDITYKPFEDDDQARVHTDDNSWSVCIQMQADLCRTLLI